VLFKVDDKIRHTANNLAGIDIGTNYKVLDVDPASSLVRIRDNYGYMRWLDEKDCAMAPCGGLEVNDHVVLLGNCGFGGFSVGTIYCVEAIDEPTDRIRLTNDNGMPDWAHCNYFGYSSGGREGSVAKDIPKPVEELKVCTCPMVDLLRDGCTCGGFEAEQLRARRGS
jgi:hypothetical protein